MLQRERNMQKPRIGESFSNGVIVEVRNISQILSSLTEVEAKDLLERAKIMFEDVNLYYEVLVQGKRSLKWRIYK